VIKADGLCAGKGVFLAPAATRPASSSSAQWARTNLGGRPPILLEEALVGEGTFLHHPYRRPALRAARGNPRP